MALIKQSKGKPNDVNEMFDQVLDCIEDLKVGRLSKSEAKEIFNGYGKAINLKKLEEVERIRIGNKEPIPFLNVDYGNTKQLEVGKKVA